MKINRFTLITIIGMLLTLALPLAADTTPVFLGLFANPFTTFRMAGELANPGELDWYRFDVTYNDTTIIVMAEGKGDEHQVRALLFDDQDGYIAIVESGRLQVVLAAGSYRIRIDSTKSDLQSYFLVVFNGIESECNDGLLEAGNLGAVTGLILLSASMAPPGDADFFRFAIPEYGLPETSNALRIETHGALAGDTTLVLYQYNEVEDRYMPIASDDDSGDAFWSRLLLRPQPGDRYAVRVEETVFPLGGIEYYNLSIKPITLVIDAEPNNTSASALILMPTSPGAIPWTADGFLDADDSIDFYRLTINVPGLTRIWTAPQPNIGDFDTLLTLYTHNGDRIVTNDDGGQGLWSRIDVSLDAGEYFITVESAALADKSFLPYRLQATVQDVKAVSEMEPNDTDETAQLIEWDQGVALQIEAAIGLDGDSDSFRFVLDEDTTVVFETGARSGLTENYDTTLALYDEDLWEMAFDDDSGEGGWSRIEASLPAGTYYIVVKSYFSQMFDYMLLITQPQ